MTESTVSETEGLKYTILLAVIIFLILLTCFESIRGIKNIFLKRITRKFQKNKRVPKPPPKYFLGWIRHILQVSEPEFLYMVGLDGYIFMRFIVVCLKISCFLAFWGVIILLPIYASSNGQQKGWNKYTLANVVDGERLWVPAIFAYIFTGYICHLFYREYQGFVKKRLEYLVRGDMDTHQQTYFTLMVENLPPTLRSAPKLKDFFETLFPENVFAVNVCLELGELESLVEKRKQCRASVENDVAFAHATGRGPIKWISAANFHHIQSCLAEVLPKYPIDAMLGIVESSAVTQPYVLSRSCYSMTIKVNATLYHAYKLHALNYQIQGLQVEFIEREDKMHELEIHYLKSHPNSRANVILQYLFEDEKGQETFKTPSPELCAQMDPAGLEEMTTGGWGGEDGEEEKQQLNEDWMMRMSQVRGRKYSVDSNPESIDENIDVANVALVDEGISSSGHAKGARLPAAPHPASSTTTAQGPFDSLLSLMNNTFNQTSGSQKLISTLLDDGKYVAMHSATGFAKEGARTARNVRQSAMKSVLEATKVIEQATSGSLFRTSSTAFVTFTSRVSTGVGYQMLLSHENYHMTLKPAPCTTDIIWKNIALPQLQIDSRTKISAAILIIGAIFWSFVVTTIHSIFNLQKLGHGRYAEYENNLFYLMFNSYLAVGILLIFLTLLPLLFDSISRYYECLKTESEIQNSIMVRYFYYQLANIYVTVTAGSIVTSIEHIWNHPESALRILGESLPKVSIYFATIIILMTFTSVMIEFMRIWPIICYYSATFIADKRRITRRSLRSGAFAAARMLYGWIYPSLLMVFMIISVFSCIAPITMCFAVVYYSFVYLMYKYQLLYVYVNEYQSGGYMWYAVFNMSMMVVICGLLTLMGFISSKMGHKTAPFYFLIPLPILVAIFWRYCNQTFLSPSLNLSLEHAGIIDGFHREHKKKGFKTALDTFREQTYRQPSLTDPQLFPEPYRLKTSFGSVHNKEPLSNGTTFNAILTSSPPGATSAPAAVTRVSSDNSKREPIVRRRSNPFDLIRVRRGSFSSMEIPTMRDSAADVESGQSQLQQQRHLQPRSREELDEEDDEEQLELYVNDILGGVADMEEIEPGDVEGKR